MYVEKIFEFTESVGVDFYIGLPDSLLNLFIDEIEKSGKEHIVVVNEAHAVGIAFGLMLGKKNPCVYLQNSGLGNIIKDQ